MFKIDSKAIPDILEWRKCITGRDIPDDFEYITKINPRTVVIICHQYSFEKHCFLDEWEFVVRKSDGFGGFIPYDTGTEEHFIERIDAMIASEEWVDSFRDHPDTWGDYYKSFLSISFVNDLLYSDSTLWSTSTSCEKEVMDIPMVMRIIKELSAPKLRIRTPRMIERPYTEKRLGQQYRIPDSGTIGINPNKYSTYLEGFGLTNGLSLSHAHCDDQVDAIAYAINSIKRPKKSKWYQRLWNRLTTMIHNIKMYFRR